MNLSAEIERLAQLHASGVISAEEFSAAKARLIHGQAPTPPPIPGAGFGAYDTEKNWLFALHLSQFAGYVIPLAGWVLPFLIWQLKKDQLPALDPHGKVVANWLISLLIYTVISIPLCFIGIGILIMIVLGVLGIVFPILGAIRANEGTLWRYPLSIQFFK